MTTANTISAPALLSRLLLLSVAVTALLPDTAQANGWRSSASRQEAPVNTENNTIADSAVGAQCAPTPATALPFSVSVDGEPMTGSGLGGTADSQRCADLALARADVQIRYDGLAPEHRLAVRAAPDATLRGREVRFATYSNYVTRLARGEIRIFAAGDTVRQEPLAILPLDKGTTRWEAPATRDDHVSYVLRVYDHDGNFDETLPRQLNLADERGGKTYENELNAVYDANDLAVRNIPVTGGAVTVSGRNVAPGSTVKVMGRSVPVDSKGDFAFREILPPGPQNVRVEITDAQGRVAEFSRSATIPDNDWFYVALADLTVGHGSSGNHSALSQLDPVKADEYDGKTKVNGRLAFYLKGKIRGDVLLTAAADTREQPIGHLFSNFDEKDPHYLLRRLDPDRYYPVYGDDSTVTEDAPTRGKFYVRLERGGSHILWGNFKTSINGTEFVRYDRGLYGAKVRGETTTETKYGEKRGVVEAFTAEPGTSGARDVFRGTGGSLYYLRRQNITHGSERVTVELRDKDTGLVLRSKVLVPGEDYDMNVLQGRLVLNTPLASTASDDFVVRESSLAGHPQFLVVTYEYTPGLDKSEDRVAGGRASVWVNDHVQIGATGYDQSEPGRDQRLLGADLTLRYLPGTYIKIEGAQSRGPGAGEAISYDGGFSFDTRTASGREAWAKRVEAAADLSELMPGRNGRVAAYWQEKDEGFSGPGNLTLDRGGREMGVSSETSIGALSLKSRTTRKEDEFRRNTATQADVGYALNPHWTITVGVRIDDNMPFATSASPTLNQEGRRTDVGARLTYDSHRDWLAYVFGQGTVETTGDRDRNNRVGVGAEARLTAKLKANAEISTGDGGIGGKIGTEYQINDQSVAYLSYILDTDRTDLVSRGGEGVFVTGARTRYSDNFSVFGEERYRHGAGYSGLTHAYGLDFVPWLDWRTGLAFEMGTLTDPFAGDTERLAVSGSIGFARENVSFSGKLEYRNDVRTKVHDGAYLGESERDTWLFANSLGVKIARDWRLIGKLNGSYSDATLGDFYDGDYLEAVTGFAYRPVDNDRLNALFKYTFFYDLPSVAQASSNGRQPDYAQESQVLSVDADYDVVSWLTVGAKYAFRFGSLRDSRDESADWVDSRAHLLVGRVNVHLNKSWDVLAEARMLDAADAEDQKVGALVAVYRHINDNVMIGVGYNFTDFSDDITDLSYDSEGVFLNVVGKF